MIDIRNSIDPKLDLVLERVVDVPVELVWKAWTQPEHMKAWFCPRPWMLTECELELHPGGLFRTVMQGPEGERHEGYGCFLDIVENRRLVWTDALEKGYRPNTHANDCFDGRFTAFVLMEPQGSGTKYTAIARHSSEAASQKHQEIGFEAGWGTALTQLVEYVKTL